ncbi:MAG: rod shape-determining protein [Eubacterium sp.]|nr:rod shape-determining protein [Eubacterium sp.]
MANHVVVGLDLGTQNIKISSKALKGVVCEKNVIALEGSRLYAYGDDAYGMYEKAPDNITVSFPIQSGVIANYRDMRDILVAFINKYFKNIKGATIIIAVPTDISEVEKRSYFDLVENCKFKLSNILVCEKPIAAATGLGLSVNSASGMLIVDIGADTTEISVLSLGGIVISRLIKVGGNHMANAISAALKKDNNLVIGQRSAQKILAEIGYAANCQEETMSIVGRDMLSGFPVTSEVKSTAVYEAIKDYLEEITESVKFILERTPPELTSDIIDNGMYVTGGVSRIKNIDVLLSEATELDVNISDNPIENAVLGLEKIASDRELSSLAYSMSSPKNRFYK